MLEDLHSHTYYSFCGGDKPETIVEAAIEAGLDVFGITDHNYGVGYGRHSVFMATAEMGLENYERTLERYYDHMDLIREKYRDRIQVLRGIEICTLRSEVHRNFALPDGADISYFDYCLIENLDHPDSITKGDIFAYAKRCGCPTGIAHTDLFAHMAHIGANPGDYLSRMADEGIFWEMNVNYDSIHGYREHAYVRDFLSDPEKLETARKSGVRISVGFDGHRVKDYCPDRVRAACRRLTEAGIRMPFEE